MRINAKPGLVGHLLEAYEESRKDKAKTKTKGYASEQIDLPRLLRLESMKGGLLRVSHDLLGGIQCDQVNRRCERLRRRQSSYFLGLCPSTTTPLRWLNDGMALPREFE